jgi:predicted SAM-dependent methyltransferase
MIRKKLKEIRPLVKLYQRLFLPPRPSKAEEQWVRIVMDQATENLVKSLDYSSFKTLEISGNKWKNFGFLSYENKFFPELDICKSGLDKFYDLIIAEQVFEHLAYPYRAGKNVFEMLKPGGYFLITTPFLLKIHPDPIDCNRWTPLGLNYFLNECGFELEDILVESWGNRECLVANFDEWKRYKPKSHSLENDPNLPLVVWALARKK